MVSSGKYVRLYQVTCEIISRCSIIVFSRGRAFTSFTLEPRIFLPLMYKILQSKGVRMVKQALENAILEDDKLWDEFDVIVNCTGAAARYCLRIL